MADWCLRNPGRFKSFVYIGANLSDEDEEDTWYFQPVFDFAKGGAALIERAVDRPVVCLTRANERDMQDIYCKSFGNTCGSSGAIEQEYDPYLGGQDDSVYLRTIV